MIESGKYIFLQIILIILVIIVIVILCSYKITKFSKKGKYNTQIYLARNEEHGPLLFP